MSLANQSFRTIVVGLGVQGKKRKHHSGEDYRFSVDPFSPEADYRLIYDVPLEQFDAALVCTPDDLKLEIIQYLLRHQKNILVEKPLIASDEMLINLQKLANDNNVFCYTAYNHRFEPNFIRMKELICSGKLGKIYNCRIFYGNGTARLVRNSAWRDKGAGVLPDLGSHLLDTINFWFDIKPDDFRVTSASCFENNSLDHVVVNSNLSSPKLELEMTLLMWRNHFTCDILAENGSAHIESLCKWGPSKFIYRERKLPSGRPREDIKILIDDDPTWKAEYEYFRSACGLNLKTNLSADLWINQILNKLANESFELIK